MQVASIVTCPELIQVPRRSEEEIAMKAMILVAIATITLTVSAANSQTQYRAPAHNFYQNNWMSGY
jgi:hypothetical protein